MLNSIFPLFYGIIVIVLLWQAFRVMSKGFFADQRVLPKNLKATQTKEDRTGRLTVHPEILDKEGRITNEDLLTVRFSGDIDPSKSTENPSE